MTNTTDTTALTLHGHDGRKYLTAAERLRFLDRASNHPRRQLGCLCLVLAYTGCRLSEALAVTAASVDVSDGSVTFRCLKKRHADIYRTVPLPRAVVTYMRDVHDLTALDPRQRLWPWSRGHGWELVKSVLAECGISDGPHAAPKGLRHGFGVHAIQCGIPLHLLQRWLGHSRLATTAIYAEALGPEERQLAERMWEPLLSVGIEPHRAAPT